MKLHRQSPSAKYPNLHNRQFAKLSGVDLLIIDDFGLKPLKNSQDQDFHDLVSERYERTSTIVTSNLDIPEWTDAFPNKLLGPAKTGFTMEPTLSSSKARAFERQGPCQKWKNLLLQKLQNQHL